MKKVKSTLFAVVMIYSYSFIAKIKITINTVCIVISCHLKLIKIFKILFKCGVPKIISGKR